MFVRPHTNTMRSSAKEENQVQADNSKASKIGSECEKPVIYWLYDFFGVELT